MFYHVPYTLYKCMCFVSRLGRRKQAQARISNDSSLPLTIAENVRDSQSWWAFLAERLTLRVRCSGADSVLPHYRCCCCRGGGGSSNCPDGWRCRGGRWRYQDPFGGVAGRWAGLRWGAACRGGATDPNPILSLQQPLRLRQRGYRGLEATATQLRPGLESRRWGGQTHGGITIIRIPCGNKMEKEKKIVLVRKYSDHANYSHVLSCKPCYKIFTDWTPSLSLFIRVSHAKCIIWRKVQAQTQTKIYGYLFIKQRIK